MHKQLTWIVRSINTAWGVMPPAGVGVSPLLSLKLRFNHEPLHPKSQLLRSGTSPPRYLNRIREVKPKKGDAFLACDIGSPLMVPANKPEYRRFATCAYPAAKRSTESARCVPAVEGRTQQC